MLQRWIYRLALLNCWLGMILIPLKAFGLFKPMVGYAIDLTVEVLLLALNALIASAFKKGLASPKESDF